MTILIAIIGFSCIILCDFLLSKLTFNNFLLSFISKDKIRMALSYLLGLSIFLIGLKLISLFL